MSKRYIGIDLDEGTLRLALATEEKNGPRLLKVAERTGVEPEQLAKTLTEFLGAPLAFGDRLALGLPARKALVRWLEFPFSDPSKIKASLELELTSRLPIALDDHVTDAREPRPAGGKSFIVEAAAVRKDLLEPLIGTLDQTALPVQIIDLKPFALVAGLREREQITDAVLACLEENESFLALVRDSRVVGLRLLPGGAPEARTLARDSLLLQKGATEAGLPLFLTGSGATPELLTRLREIECEAFMVQLLCQTELVPAACIPAAALALRAALPTRCGEFNFRKGPFALKGEWVALKRQMIIAAALLILTLAAGATGAWLNYSAKSRQADALQKEMTQVFTATFPGTKPIADIPLQMRSKIKELQQKSRLLGAEGGSSALQVLKEISTRTPSDVKVDLREYVYSPENLVLDGSTTTFDAVNQLARALEQSPELSEVKVADAKMSLDGSRVDFRLTLNLAAGEKKP